jgi:hypothetical protein
MKLGLVVIFFAFCTTKVVDSKCLINVEADGQANAANLRENLKLEQIASVYQDAFDVQLNSSNYTKVQPGDIVNSLLNNGASSFRQDFSLLVYAACLLLYLVFINA